MLEPFDDIVPRALPKAPEEAPKKKKKKEKKNLSLLSFGEEAAAEEVALQEVNTKVMSSHDVLNDARSASEACLVLVAHESSSTSAARARTTCS